MLGRLGSRLQQLVPRVIQREVTEQDFMHLRISPPGGEPGTSCGGDARHSRDVLLGEARGRHIPSHQQGLVWRQPP